MRNSTVKISKETVLFFDLDGTLVDTNFSNFLAYQKAVMSILKTDFEMIYDCKQRMNRTNLKNIIPDLTDRDCDLIIQEKERICGEYLPHCELIKCNAEILFEYSKKNRTYLVTNCRYDRAISTLKYFDIYEKFDEVFCRQINLNQVKINKYSIAISKLKISPEYIVVFENEESEIQDAIASGILNENILFTGCVY